MQNEACIKQGSEKESIRQQLTDALKRLNSDCLYTTCDVEEKTAIQAIRTAADKKQIAPKACIRAAETAKRLVDAKAALFQIGYAVLELNDDEAGDELKFCVADYLAARAQLLGFEKSLSPKGWDILES